MEITAHNPVALFPDLREIPQPPEVLFVKGSLERTKDTRFLTVVGSRKCSAYGTAVCKALIEGLAGYPITIISGLAVGIDTIAHESALSAGLPTLAFPGSGLGKDVLYPTINRALADHIIESGGALVSEYSEHFRPTHWSFPRRNRLEAGIGHMTLVIEAEERSGTLITAKLAAEYNRIVGAVPGPITMPTSRGVNWLLREGAVPVTKSADILEELGFKIPAQRPEVLLNEHESRVLEILEYPLSREEIISRLELSPLIAQGVFATLAIKGQIIEQLGQVSRA